MAHIHAPFTLRQVEALNRYQQSGAFHPFTCRNRGDGRHRTTIDLGVLEATRAGWVCPDCEYRQNWAHDFMADEQAWWTGRAS